MRALRPLLLTLLVSSLAGPAFAYIIYLKDGTRLTAKEKYELRGEQALIVLQNGTRTSIAASEIDQERTREANEGGYGSALVLDDGRLTELPADEPPEAEGSLSDIIGDRKSKIADRPLAKRPLPPVEPAPASAAGGGAQDLPRRPFSDPEMAAQVQRIFRAQGVEQVAISQGSAPDRLLIDLTTNSEAAVFRALEVASRALLHTRDLYPGSSSEFELLLSTTEREPAGQFVLTGTLARQLADGEVETSAFFIEHVRF